MINNKSTTFKWIGRAPENNRQVALLIPQYNEYSNSNMEKRLGYFNGLAKRFKLSLDIILIDDGSLDDSLRIMKDFIYSNKAPVYLASVFPNANKVGALFSTIVNIQHDFVITSDFDTDIDELDNFFQYLPKLEGESSLMGAYFRMLPFEGAGNVFLFQQIEYSFQRDLYRFHEKELSVRVMPGAGSCYKRDILISIFREHSGLRNGEDRETTILGIKKGYKAFYMIDVLALTRPPLTFTKLLRQRIRWNLGYLETFSKERKYYLAQISKFNRVGVVTLVDMIFVVSLLLFPFITVGLFFVSIKFCIILILGAVLGGILWAFNWILKSKGEYKELNGNIFKASIIFPFFKLSIEYLAWMKAIRDYFRKKSPVPGSGKWMTMVQPARKNERVNKNEINRI